MFKRRETKVKTTDNWCPNFPNDEVEVTLMKLKEDKPTYRICVWGEDDLGMEIDVQTNDPSKLIKMYDKLIAQPFITMTHLKSLGFVSA
jgi:hypothetical protein